MKNIKMSDLFRPSWLLLHRNRKPGIDCICAEGTRMTRVTPSDNVTDCVKHFCSQHSVSFFWTLKLWKHSQRYGTRCSGTLNSFLYGFLCGSCPKNWWLFSLKYCLHFKKKIGSQTREHTKQTPDVTRLNIINSSYWWFEMKLPKRVFLCNSSPVRLCGMTFTGTKRFWILDLTPLQTKIWPHFCLNEKRFGTPCLNTGFRVEHEHVANLGASFIIKLATVFGGSWSIHVP